MVVKIFPFALRFAALAPPRPIRRKQISCRERRGRIGQIGIDMRKGMSHLDHEKRVSKQAAEERYRSLRRKAFRSAEQMLVDAHVARPEELTLSEIPPLSLHVAVLGWANDPARRVNWDWIGMLARYRKNYPSRFELAVFAEGDVCALALGKPSATRSHCSLEFVEASPEPTHALKHRVLNIVFTALEHYCVAIGAAEMRIVEPLSDLIPVYTARHGFSVAQDQNRRPYCWREVHYER